MRTSTTEQDQVRPNWDYNAQLSSILQQESELSALREPTMLSQAADKVIQIAHEYQDFAENHPNLATMIIQGASTGVIVAVGAARGRLPGAITSLGAALMKNQLISAIAGKQITQLTEGGISIISDHLQGFDPTLTQDQARALSTAVVLSALTYADAKQQLKPAMSIFKNITPPATSISTVNSHSLLFTGNSRGSDIQTSRIGKSKTSATRIKTPEVRQLHTARDKIVENPHLAGAYIKEVQKLTGKKIPEKQRNLLTEAIKKQEYKKLSRNAAEKHRVDFDNTRNKIREEWSNNTGRPWPTYQKEVMENGVKVLKPSPYEAHHIIQLDHGGPNEWWNMHPALRSEHTRIHGKNSIARQIFTNSKKYK